jgi:hypothetical protein
MITALTLASSLWLTQAPPPPPPAGTASTVSPSGKQPAPPPPNPPPPTGTTRALPPAAPPPPGMNVPPPAAPFDLTKVGPMSRKPTNEALTRKELELFVMQEDQLATQGNIDARLARIDFPVTMITDDAKGVPEVHQLSRDEYLAEMKPFWDSQPKDTKVVHRLNIAVLSDSLAVVTDDYTQLGGGQKLVARSSSMVVKRDGQWRWKTMAEAGWGGMPPPPAEQRPPRKEISAPIAPPTRVQQRPH